MAFVTGASVAVAWVPRDAVAAELALDRRLNAAAASEGVALFA